MLGAIFISTFCHSKHTSIYEGRPSSMKIYPNQCGRLLWHLSTYKHRTFNWPEMRSTYMILDREQTTDFMYDFVLCVEWREQLHKYLDLLKNGYTENVQKKHWNGSECFIFEYTNEFLQSVMDSSRPINRKYIKTTFPIPISPSKGAHPMAYFFIMEEIKTYPFKRNDLEDPRKVMRYYASVLIALCISEMYLEAESRFINDGIIIYIISTLVDKILASYWYQLCICKHCWGPEHLHPCSLCLWFTYYKGYIHLELYKLYISKRSDLKSLSFEELVSYCADW